MIIPRRTPYMARDVTAGGFIHIKLLRRNPLRGNVGIDAQAGVANCCSSYALDTRSVALSFQPKPTEIFQHSTSQHEGFKHRLSPFEENYQKGMWKLSYCGLSTILFFFEL